MPSITDRKALKKSILRAARDSLPPIDTLKTWRAPSSPSPTPKPWTKHEAPVSRRKSGCARTFTINLYKTELCVHWTEFGACPYGKMCQYAHGQSDLHDPLPFDKEPPPKKLEHEVVKRKPDPIPPGKACSPKPGSKHFKSSFSPSSSNGAMPAAKPAAALAKPAIVLASPSAKSLLASSPPTTPIKMPPGLSPHTSTGGKKSLEMFKFGLSPVVPMPSLEKNVRETEITRVPVPSQIAFEMLKELLDEGRTSMFTRDIAGAAVTTCKEGQCALLVSTMRGEPRAPLVIKRVKRLVIYAMWNREALGARANIDRFLHAI